MLLQRPREKPRVVVLKGILIEVPGITLRNPRSHTEQFSKATVVANPGKKPLGGILGETPREIQKPNSYKLPGKINFKKVKEGHAGTTV